MHITKQNIQSKNVDNEEINSLTLEKTHVMKNRRGLEILRSKKNSILILKKKKNQKVRDVDTPYHCLPNR